MADVGGMVHTKSSRASLMAVTTNTNTNGRMEVMGMRGLMEGMSWMITTIKK